jgi:hypothetical protein
MEQGLPLPPALEESGPVELFKGKVAAWAERIGVQPQSVTVRPMRRKETKANLTAGDSKDVVAKRLLSSLPRRRNSHTEKEVLYNER